LAARKKKVDWLMIFNYPGRFPKMRPWTDGVCATGPKKERKNLLSDPPSGKQHTHTRGYNAAATIRGRCWTEQDLGGVHQCDYAKPSYIFLDAGEIEGRRCRPFGS
jgi:hypothetical protein